MKSLLLGISLLVTMPTFAKGGAYFEIVKRCDSCSPLAQTRVTAQESLTDVYSFGLVAQNTDNVYRWHKKEALTKLWSMDFGLYYCEGKFRLTTGNGQNNLFVDDVLKCRKATDVENKTYRERFRGGHRF